MVAIAPVVIEVLGVVLDGGWAAPDLTAIAFLLSMNDTSDEIHSAPRQERDTTANVWTTLDRMDSEL